MHVVTLVRWDEGAWTSWEATWEGNVVEIASGPLGKEADVQYYTCTSEEAASRFVEEEVEARRADGYADPQWVGDIATGPIAAMRNALLEERIANNPDDSEAYLVYADWLEANGDPRGQLITLQHKLSSDEGRGDLVEAQSRLLLRHSAHFFPEYGKGTIEISWRLGFFESAAVKSVASLESLLEHPSSALLRRLSILEATSADALVEILERHPPPSTVTGLEFDLERDTPLPSSFWSRFPALTSVTTDAALGIGSADTSRWQILRLRRRELTAPTLELLANEQWPALHTLALNLEGAQRVELGILEPLWEGFSAPELLELELRERTSISDIIHRSLIAQLSVLRLRDCSLGDSDARSMMDAPTVLDHLDILDVSNNWLSPEMARSLRFAAKKVVTTPQWSDEYDDDDYGEDDYLDEDDAYYGSDSEYSADVVPVYDDKPKSDESLEVDKTWERGVVGFEHDDE